MQELFLGLLERREREPVLISDKLARNTQENRSRSPFFQGLDPGSAEASSDIPLPQEFGDIGCSLGPCQRMKPKRARKGIAQTLPWGC